MKALFSGMVLTMILLLSACQEKNINHQSKEQIVAPPATAETPEPTKLQVTEDKATGDQSSVASSSPSSSPPPPPPPPPVMDEIFRIMPKDAVANTEVPAKMYAPAERKYEAEYDIEIVAPEGNRWEQGTGNREGYEALVENDFNAVIDEPLSTFSVDVDRASYSNHRRFINAGRLPIPSAVRMEEFINYFDYDYPAPTGETPVAMTSQIGPCPWNANHKLLHIGLQAKEVQKQNLPPANLVFLLDVSGSMNNANKLPLLKGAFRLLIKQMRPQDRIAIVVYAGSSGLVLPSTSGASKMAIWEAIENLRAGGSTAGVSGIKLAYQVAQENLTDNSNNRIILATDGDFNVGTSSDGELVKLIEKEREKGIFLSVLGFGTGNYQDAKMEKLADNGNGNYAYIDNIKEAKKVLVNEMGGTLFTVAKDVKMQIEFNPTHVKGYRLLGYENRMLENKDFNDDKKDAGDMGAGHSVTALYEIIPQGVDENFTSNVDPLKYQSANKLSLASQSAEWATLKFRYKEPKQSTSKMISHPVNKKASLLKGTSANYRLAAGLAAYAMLLRDSEHKGSASYKMAIDLAKSATVGIEDEYKRELIELMELASELSF